MATHTFETNDQVEQLLEEQATLSGESDLMQNVRKALALRHALWDHHKKDGCTVALIYPDGKVSDVTLI